MRWRPKLQILAILAGLLGFFVIFIVAENTLSYSFHRCINTETEREASERSKEQRRRIPAIIAPQLVCTLRVIDLHNGFFNLFGSIAVAAFTFTLWRSTDKLWKVATDQVNVAERTLYATERAWLSVNLASWGDLRHLPMGGYEIQLTWHIKNLGKTPAMNVHTSVRLIASASDLVEVSRPWADKFRLVDGEHSRLLLPKQNYVRKWRAGLDAREAESVGPAFLPGIMACITYQTHSDLAIRQTLVCYYLSRSGGRGGEWFLEPGKSAPRDSLRFVAAGGWAD